MLHRLRTRCWGWSHLSGRSSRRSNPGPLPPPRARSREFEPAAASSPVRCELEVAASGPEARPDRSCFPPLPGDSENIRGRLARSTNRLVVTPRPQPCRRSAAGSEPGTTSPRASDGSGSRPDAGLGHLGRRAPSCIRATPSSPSTQRVEQRSRPRNAASAPSASAVRHVEARAEPAVDVHLRRSPDGGRDRSAAAAAVVTARSSWRPPWLDTHTAAAPAVDAPAGRRRGAARPSPRPAARSCSREPRRCRPGRGRVAFSRARAAAS